MVGRERPIGSGVKTGRGANLAQAKHAYTAAVKTHHPDAGGDPGKFNLVVEAWRAAQEQLGGR
jgi:DnaJ-class molecular chaperone